MPRWLRAVDWLARSLICQPDHRGWGHDRTGAIWRDQLTERARQLLGRGAGVIADPRPDVLVVGGGILGVATAAAVHDAGLGRCSLSRRAGWAPAPPAARPGCWSPSRTSGATLRLSSTWSGPAWSAGATSTRSRPGGLGLVELDWIGLAPDPGGLAAHQPKNVEWLDATRSRRWYPALPGISAAR